MKDHKILTDALNKRVTGGVIKPVQFNTKLTKELETGQGVRHLKKDDVRSGKKAN